MAERVSVIVPTLEEAARIGPLIDALRAEPECAEVVVADGGGNDGTAEIARRHGGLVVPCGRCRGAQLAAGAAPARGEILLFLHADTVFPSGGLAALVAALDADPAAPGGNFRLLFDGHSRFAHRLGGAYAHARRFGLYYGDSGIFLRRRVYDAIGGVRPLPVMEDWDLVRRLERAGRTVCVMEPPLVTSSRKFAGRRPVAIVTGWIALHLLYFAGASPALLARIYYPPGWRRA